MNAGNYTITVIQPSSFKMASTQLTVTSMGLSTPIATVSWTFQFWNPLNIDLSFLINPVIGAIQAWWAWNPNGTLVSVKGNINNQSLMVITAGIVAPGAGVAADLPSIGARLQAGLPSLRTAAYAVFGIISAFLLNVYMQMNIAASNAVTAVATEKTKDAEVAGKIVDAANAGLIPQATATAWINKLFPNGIPTSSASTTTAADSYAGIIGQVTAVVPLVIGLAVLGMVSKVMPSKS
jgi:hypothetical protein